MNGIEKITNMHTDKLDFEEIGKMLGVPIPKELEVLNFYDIGSETILVGENHAEFNIDNYIYKFNQEALYNSLVIEFFIKKEDLKEFWRNRTLGDLWEPNDRFLDLAFLTIPPYSSIVISVNAKDFGSIWLELPEIIEINGKEIFRIYLEPDFITFLSKLEKGLYEDRIEDYIPLDQKLYKNWGEDFWRVKNDN